VREMKQDAHLGAQSQIGKYGGAQAWPDPRGCDDEVQFRTADGKETGLAAQIAGRSYIATQRHAAKAGDVVPQGTRDASGNFPYWKGDRCPLNGE
jgi:hypothetical protein